jgi:hypothetical protein
MGHILGVNEAHLERILRSYVRHYNDHRPHQGHSHVIPNPENAVPLLAIEDISATGMGIVIFAQDGHADTTGWAG